MLIDLLPYLALGITAGTVAGFIPGVGVFVTLTLFYSFLLGLSPYEILAFYLGVASTTQYIGSITATVFSVPGETSSLPAVHEGHAMFLQGKGAYAISGAAIGSFLGSLIVLSLTAIVLPYIDNVLYLFTTNVQFLLIVAVLVLICFSSSKIYLSFFLAGVGYVLGMVGCRHVDTYCFATFDDPQLMAGLPMLPVICAVYIVPKLLTETESYDASLLKKGSVQTENFFQHILYFAKHWSSSVRGTVIGFFAGFTPGMSTTVSANLSYSAEKYVQKKSGTYKQGNYQSLVAAETANNAGMFASILPLILFGVPIVPSEALLYDLAASKGFIFGRNFDFDFFVILAYLLVIANCVALLIAWPFAKYVCLLHKIPPKIFNSLIIILLMYILYSSGQVMFMGQFYLLVFFILLPLGWAFRHYNTLPLIFTFVIQSRLESVLIRLFDLYVFS